jgi:RimJ/RimL family protein N-acetyltransferase
VSAITYRPVTLDDAELVSELSAASYPALTQDAEILRYRWEHPRSDYRAARFIAERGTKPIAFLMWLHGPWAKLPERHCEVEVWLVRDELDRGLLTTLWSWIGDLAVADGSYLLLAFCSEDQPEMLDSLASLGYQRMRAEKVWELDLRTHGEKLRAESAEARRDMSGRGLQLTTLAAWDDPDKLPKLYELDAMTRQDIPTTLPILREPFADFERRLHAPNRRLDRTWVALHEGSPVGLSYLIFPPRRGTVWTGYTCSHPDYRGRGIARAIKLQTLAQAAELGVPVVRTDNDAENTPMLHINERLGYVQCPGFVEHHKRVKESGNA